MVHTISAAKKGLLRDDRSFDQVSWRFNSLLLATGSVLRDDKGQEYWALPVGFSVTVDAKRNQVINHIATELAAQLHVVDLQILHRTAFLTTPVVSLQNLLAEQGVVFRGQFEPWSPLVHVRKLP